MDEQVREELEALEAIYQQNVTTQPLQIETQCGVFSIQFTLPPLYPHHKPDYQLSFPTLFSTQEQIHWERQILATVETEFDGMFVKGEAVLFSYIEWLKEYLESLDPPVEASVVHAPDTAVTPVEQVYEMDQDGYAVIPNCPKVHHSSTPLIEKKSVFVAHVATVHTLKEIKLVRKTIMSNKQVSKATHNIGAYRIVEENGVVRQDGDDDGETAAGARLLHLLQLADVKNVYVIVSRWFGGVELGPARFKCINNCARQLLQEHRYIE